MASEPAYMENLRSLIRGDPDMSHIEAIEQELYGDSDRAAAVALGSMVETSLRRLLKSQLRDDLTSQDERQIFEYEGALGGFSSRIVMAYAMKLIGPDSRHDLDLIRHLRNAFAHSRFPIKFETPEIKAGCDQLRYSDFAGAYIPQSTLHRSHPQSASDNTHPRTRYIMACHALAYRMLVRRDGIKPGDLRAWLPLIMLIE
jgi:hypothetical protein